MSLLTAASHLATGDLEWLGRQGISAAEAERQLELLRSPRALDVERPCRIGDGISRLDPEDGELTGAWRRAAAERRLVKFVPASGAASRMFAALEWWRRGELDLEALRRAAAGSEPAALALAFAEGLDRLPFYDELRRALPAGGGEPGDLVAGGRHREVLAALLDPGGLGLAGRPKALIPFHRYAAGSRTALEEHFLEGAGYLAPPGPCRLHLTVAADRRGELARAFETARPALEAAAGVVFELELSEQARATDTLALDADGRPMRDEAGRPLLRPSGHGALIGNLGSLDADLVFVKNVDNIGRARAWPLAAAWKRALAGHLFALRSRARALGEELDARPETAVRFFESSFALEAPAAARGDGEAGAAWVRDRLRRPFRVCGVVPRSGEPGGGPFWVRDAGGGLGGQIVEPGQVDHEDPDQASVWRAATHFNPVDVVAALTDLDGRPHDLAAWVDPSAVFVSTKSHRGEPLTALERPGLWNGAMAGWNTAFVEVPLATFNPVKTVVDLLRPEHQPVLPSAAEPSSTEA